VPDLLGYGLSEHPTGFGFTVREQVQALLGFVHALELEELLFMGQRWGDLIALGVSVQRPESIRGIAFGSTFAWRSNCITRLIGQVLRLGVIQRWMVNGEGFIERVMGLCRTPLTREELDHYQLVASTPEMVAVETTRP
jgi:haloalkane dehalogenase